MKKLVILLGLALALSMVFATGAFANFGPHGGYAVDTDSCAACHRAHSSFSSIQFTPKDPGATDPTDYPYALLVGNASTMTQFCDACHGDTAVGASTNVVSGIFDTGPSGASGVTAGTALGDGTVTQYVTNSTFNSGLNGGGFNTAVRKNSNGVGVGAPVSVTSMHMLADPSGGAVLPNWGFANTVSGTTLTCTDCHDPHGSSNYRLLKDTVNGQNVALNVFGDDDQANYPYADGWKRGADGGAAQMASYVPNYTGGTRLVHNAGGQVGSLSDWCAACHTEYNTNQSDMSYSWSGAVQGPYSDPAGATAVARHRHPMNVSPASGDAIIQVAAYSNPAWGKGSVPLERMSSDNFTSQPGYTYSRDDILGCLTCHVAHGSSQVMTGWANAKLTVGNGTNGVATGLTMPVRQAGAGGVDPTFDSTLLRAISVPCAKLATRSKNHSGTPFAGI